MWHNGENGREGFWGRDRREEQAHMEARYQGSFKDCRGSDAKSQATVARRSCRDHWTRILSLQRWVKQCGRSGGVFAICAGQGKDWPPVSTLQLHWSIPPHDYRGRPYRGVSYKPENLNLTHMGLQTWCEHWKLATAFFRITQRVRWIERKRGISVICAYCGRAWESGIRYLR